MADDRRPKTIITSARDDCYAFFFFYAYCNVQYTASQRMITTVLLCINSTVNMEFDDFNKKSHCTGRSSQRVKATLPQSSTYLILKFYFLWNVKSE